MAAVDLSSSLHVLSPVKITVKQCSVKSFQQELSPDVARLKDAACELSPPFFDY